MKNKLEQLAQIADLIKEVELARLSRSQSVRQYYSDQAKQLRTTRKAIYGLPVDDTARLTGTDIRWQTWADMKLRELSIQEARAASTEEEQKQSARKAFGRANALQSLSKRDIK